MEDVKLIFDLHHYQLKHYPKSDAFTAKINGTWKPISIQEAIRMANALSLALLADNINKGDKIAMIANNRPEWHITDLAITQIGAVNVPIYPTITEEDYAYIMNDAGVKMVFVSDKDLLNKVLSIKDKVPTLKEVFTFDNIDGATHWSDFYNPYLDKDTTSIENIKADITEEDLATLIYTSGTTGNPKGVMLSHKNIVSNVIGCIDRLPCDEHSKSLSFLPLCHVYERTVCYLYIYRGVSIYYAENMDTIGDNLKEVQPQVFTAVPRLLEKVYDKIVAKGNELSGIKKALFFWALNLGLKYDPEKNLGGWYNWQLKMANKIIFNKWREALGNNTLAIASGSAALQPRLARVFLAAQIPVMEGYGLTETSPVVAVNSQKTGVRIGTVGKPLFNVQVKIADDGEILVKGPNVMMGYYNLPEKTKEVIDEDGWLHTGDIGELSADGFLKITDRKKEIFKTSGGKYIAPQLMENKFKESRFIEQIMIVGENEKMPAAIIQPDFAFLKEWCLRKKINCTTNEEMVKNPKVIERFQKEIDQLNEHFAKYEKVKKFELCPEPWTIDGGELTPTLKLKRKNIINKYKDLYEKIYGHTI
ncbi:MAG: AMP-dependent synthetase/ligase [Vicingaceae bacterium]